jgi:hypothetical protein
VVKLRQLTVVFMLPSLLAISCCLTAAIETLEGRDPLFGGSSPDYASGLKNAVLAVAQEVEIV